MLSNDSTACTLITQRIGVVLIARRPVAHTHTHTHIHTYTLSWAAHLQSHAPVRAGGVQGCLRV